MKKMDVPSAPTTPTLTSANAREILASVKPLAVKYYKLTGKPLGVTGEVGETEAASLFGLTLVSARTTGFDALRGNERVQIKTRARDRRFRSMGRLSRIGIDKPCDTVMLVILDAETMNVAEVWEAPYSTVVDELRRKGSKARERGQLAVSKFISMARRTWSEKGTA